MRLINREVVDEVPYGVYVCLYDGKYVVNENHDFLSITAIKGDQKKIEEIKKVARAYGFEDVDLEFISGARQISEEEHQEQLDRMKWGLIPDPQDMPALKDELEGRNARS